MSTLQRKRDRASSSRQATSLSRTIWLAHKKRRGGEGRGRVPSSVVQYQEFAARRSTKTTELQFDDEQDGRAAEIALKARS
jgi:hypothetical protein